MSRTAADLGHILINMHLMPQPMHLKLQTHQKACIPECEEQPVRTQLQDMSGCSWAHVSAMTTAFQEPTTPWGYRCMFDNSNAGGQTISALQCCATPCVYLMRWSTYAAAPAASFLLSTSTSPAHSAASSLAAR